MFPEISSDQEERDLVHWFARTGSRNLSLSATRNIDVNSSSLTISIRPCPPYNSRSGHETVVWQHTYHLTIPHMTFLSISLTVVFPEHYTLFVLLCLSVHQSPSFFLLSSPSHLLYAACSGCCKGFTLLIFPKQTQRWLKAGRRGAEHELGRPRGPAGEVITPPQEVISPYLQNQSLSQNY